MAHNRNAFFVAQNNEISDNGAMNAIRPSIPRLEYHAIQGRRLDNTRAPSWPIQPQPSDEIRRIRNDDQHSVELAKFTEIKGLIKLRGNT